MKKVYRIKGIGSFEPKEVESGNLSCKGCDLTGKECWVLAFSGDRSVIDTCTFMAKKSIRKTGRTIVFQLINN